jgi:uncharacterized protein YkwD
MRWIVIVLLGVPFALAQTQKAPATKAPATKPAPTKPGTVPPKEEFRISAWEQEVIDLTNAERKKEKLNPLKPSPILFAAARKHSLNMAKQDKLEHELDGKTPTDRMVAEGYKFMRTAENIAMGQRSPKQVVEGWMNSEGHRKNILTPELTEIGIGIEKNAKGQFYWTQNFGTPRK